MSADVVALDPQYRQTTYEYDRLYQRHAVRHGIHWCPVDEVSSTLYLFDSRTMIPLESRSSVHLFQKSREAENRD